MLLKLALKSLLYRRVTVLLTVLSLTISMCLMLGLEHMRVQAKESFTRTISGTDLIVGARSGQLNLLLYSVFRMGNPTNNMSWDSYQRLEQNKWVDWLVPISLGDSFKGYRVVGTTQDYFERYKFGQKQSLEFAQGEQFENVLDVVLGAEVAAKLKLTMGDKITLSHGIGSTSFTNHDEFPFTVVGILAATGTPVDQAVHVSLQGIELIHDKPGRHDLTLPLEQLDGLQPKTITATLLGLTSKLGTFQLQRQINTDKREAMMAIIPGVALTELWQMLGMVENLLLFISYMVLGAALVGMCTMLLASINERVPEINMLRMIGAGPMVIASLILLEAIAMLLLSILSGLVLLKLFLIAGQGWLSSEYGLFISTEVMSEGTGYLMLIALICCVFASILPTITLYNKALSSRH